MGIITEIKCLFGSCTETKVLKEIWLPPTAPGKTTRLLRFYECPICHKTKATITSPEVEETRFSQPEFWMANQETKGAKA